MNKTQKLVQEQFLNNEEAVIRRLKSVYNQSLKDITEKTKELQAQIEAFDALEGIATDPEELARIKSMKQSKVYQKQYQEALKKQVNGILDNMQVEEFNTVDSYLKKCYEDGFVGTVYDLHNQGIPLIMPLDQTAMVRAVQLDSKISQGLYTRLGEDVSLLKKKITATVSRSISTGISYQQAAKQLASYTNIGYNNAVRIARTEGHRIQVQSSMDACEKAKEKGADVVKQWDATLDSNTRESHQAVDGEIRELDKPFSNGLMFPGDPSGGASEVVNCRCALLQRARWALDDDELQTLKERAEYFGLDKTENFDDFKKKYLKAAEQLKTQESNPKFTQAKTVDEAKSRLEEIFDGVDFERLDEVDPELFINTVNELCELENKFGIIEKQGATFSINGKAFNSYGSKGAVAAIDEKEFVNGVLKKPDMSINPSVYADRDLFVKDTKYSIEQGYLAPCSDDKLDVSTIVHEYGHMLQDSITYRKYDDLVSEYQKVTKEHRDLWNNIESGKINYLDVMDKDSDMRSLKEELKRKIDGFKAVDQPKLAREINKEISHIAKDLMRERYPDFADRSDDELEILGYVSRYGQSTPFEFFAEVFSNSQCGAPNILGEAMNIWLEKGGYLK